MVVFGNEKPDIEVTPPPPPEASRQETNEVQRRRRRSIEQAQARLSGVGRSQLQVPGLFAPFRRRR